jgi:hypothetical protein
LGQALGHRVTIFVPDCMSQERVALLRPTCELPHEPSPGLVQPRGLSRAAPIPSRWAAPTRLRHMRRLLDVEEIL